MNETTETSLQMDHSESEIISGDIKTLAEACSSHFRVSTRYWSLIATIMLIVLTSKPSNNGVSLLGFNMDPVLLYPACGTLLAILNIAFCSAHLHAYRVTLIYHELLDAKNAESQSFTENYSVSDVAHALYLPALNRIYPLIHFWPYHYRNVVYKVLKFPTDLFFYSLPIFVCYYSIWRFFTSNPFEWTWFMAPLIVLVIVSTGASLILINTGYKWIHLGPKIMSKNYQEQYTLRDEKC